MIRRRRSSRSLRRGSRDAPTALGAGRRRPIPATVIARIGAPPLIALGTALSLLALLVCAFFAPGFILPAGAETTVPPAQPLPSEPVPVEPAPGRALATLPWGDGPGAVGLLRTDEGLTRGPEALAVSPDGRVAILDSVNRRLVVLSAEGSITGTIPVALSEPRFLAVDDQRLYVFDTDADQCLLSFDWAGAQTNSAPIPALDDVVTGLFASEAGPCIEVAHDDVYLVKLKESGRQGTTDGRVSPAALRTLAGRPIDRDLGRAAKATFKPDKGLKLRCFKVDKTTLKALEVETTSPAIAERGTVEHLVSLDGDTGGRLLIGARLLQQPEDPADNRSLVISGLTQAADESGDWIIEGRLELADSAFAYLGQPYVVAPDGRVFQPVADDSGYTILIHSLFASQALPGGAETADEEVEL